MRSIRIALAGNPNAGKTSIFNALTGAHQHTGNWPGKTVEKKEGELHHNGVKMTLVDLPGAYSLSAFSPEEAIARDYLVHERPDAVVMVVDVTNLERHLYLTVQVLELGIPVVVALNMMDVAQAHGLSIDVESLSRALQSPVAPTVAKQRQGVDGLLIAIMDVVQNESTQRRPHEFSGARANAAA